VTWTAGDRLHVVRTDAGRHETTTAEVADRGATATLVGLVLFLRRVPAEAAAYDVPIFVHAVGAVRVVRVEAEAPPAGGATPALVASAVMEGMTVRVELAGRERRPWRIVQAKGPGTVVFSERSPGAAPPAEPVDAGTPATTPREPGVRFLVGVMTGDEALVASVFHWPSLLAAEKAKSGFSGDEAALRKEVLERLTATYQSVPRAEAERKARAAAAAGAEEADGEQVRVRFGEPLARLSYVAKSIGGAWYVVEMLPVR
jgi:hypothetical protein